MDTICQCCKQEVSANDIRLGYCWNCTNAESIIHEGLDIDNKGLNGSVPAKTAMEKLSLLIQKGWKK